MTKRRRSPKLDNFPSQVINLDSFGDSESPWADIQPFPHRRLDNFVNSDFLEIVKTEILRGLKGNDSINFRKKSNDLYEFHQSDELVSCKNEWISKLRDSLYSSEVRERLSQITGIKLSDKPDMFAAVYQKTHRLLCHDDQLESRRVAYIVYLAPPGWEAKDGGALDLFSATPEGHPGDVAVSLVPKWNSFAFFEVSQKSFHQVAEVLADKNRVSIGGWFHGAPIVAKHSQIVRSLSVSTELESVGALAEWINPKYLGEGIAEQIREQFLSEGSLELGNFLTRKNYRSLVKALNECSEWSLVGPPNRNRFESLETTDGIIAQINRLLQSKEFAGLLAKWTNLELCEQSASIRRFKTGSYTLASDLDQKENTGGLDVFLCCPSNDNEWTEKQGGSVHYMDSDEELLTLLPSFNTLSLVYRDDGQIMQFVRYVNCTARATRHDFKVAWPVEADSDSGESDEFDSEDFREW
eukprot:844271_1